MDATDSAAPATIDDFLKLDLRVGTVRRAEPFPAARKPSLKLWIDFGPEIGERQSSAQITDHYSAETLVGRQVMAVVNLSPRRIAGFESQVLTLGLPDGQGGVVLIGPGQPVPDGGRLY